MELLSEMVNRDNFQRVIQNKASLHMKQSTGLSMLEAIDATK